MDNVLTLVLLHFEINCVSIMKTDAFILDFNLVLETMIEKCSEGEGPSVYMCKLCLKRMSNKTKIKRHAEIHLDLSHPCNICYKQFKTRNALSQHYSTVHGQTVSHSQI